MVQSKNPTASILDALCADQLRNWIRGEQVLVESYRLTHSKLLSNRESLLVLIAHEIGLRRSLGFDTTLDSFVERFPDFELDLQELFRGGSSEVSADDQAAPHRAKVDTKPLADTLGYLSPSGGSSAPPSSHPAAPAAAPAAAPFPAPSPNNPVPFGDYELLERVAHGAMGVVFRARHLRLHRVVAIKTILNSHLASEDLVKRFYIEAEASARLEHPGIVSVYDVNQHEGRHFIAMQFVEGRSLAQYIKQQIIDERVAVKTVLQVAEAVEYAHERGVVHRDLKPQNILITAEGRPIVTDFGLAKQLYAEGHLTHTGQIIGTPAYMSPEQASAKSVGPLSDVYSLGAVLYCLLAGCPPFQRANVSDLLRDVLETPPPSLKLFRPEVDPELESICRKCLEKVPSNRFPSAGTLAVRLRQYLDAHPAPALDAAGIRDSRWPRIAHRPLSPEASIWTNSTAAVWRSVRNCQRALERACAALTGQPVAESSSHSTPSLWPKLQHSAEEAAALAARRRLRVAMALLLGLGLLAAAVVGYREFVSP